MPEERRVRRSTWKEIIYARNPGDWVTTSWPTSRTREAVA
jgi:hypothetical protein